MKILPSTSLEILQNITEGLWLIQEDRHYFCNQDDSERADRPMDHLHYRVCYACHAQATTVELVIHDVNCEWVEQIKSTKEWVVEQKKLHDENIFK